MGKIALGFLSGNKPNAEDHGNVVQNGPKDAHARRIVGSDDENARSWIHQHGALHPQPHAERVTVLLSISQ